MGGHGSGGHNRKPREVRVREGNPGKRALPKPVLMSGRPESAAEMVCPEHLIQDADAAEHWDRVVAHLIAGHQIDRADAPALEVFCAIWSTMQACQRVRAAQGAFILGPSGLKPHPCIKMWNEAAQQWRAMAAQFGLTPAARAALGYTNMASASMAAALQRDIGGEDPGNPNGEIVDAEVVEMPGLELPEATD